MQEQFKLTDDFQKFKLEFERSGILDKEVFLFHGVDGNYSYIMEHNGYEHEFILSVDKDTEMRYFETPASLLNLESIKYFKHIVRDEETKDYIGCHTYTKTIFK